MGSPYRITGPAVISFSGGRTSALMLKRILDEGLQPDVHVLFANTGKEREETLQFVHEVERHWKVRVHWLERRRAEGEAASFTEVSFENASRHGEPFATLIEERKFLPNPVTRYCTTELKIRTMKAWMLAQGYERWTNVVGLRADEPHRVAKQRAKEGSERWDLAFPLFDGAVTRDEVILWWKRQPFDLQLRSWEGNCDLCFLKGVKKRARIIEDGPDRAAWWIQQEERIAALFRSDAPSYAALFRLARDQLRMFPNGLFDEAEIENDPTDLDECGGYCESNREAA
jgi:hypothetical protein